jgi:hypothetical protein
MDGWAHQSGWRAPARAARLAHAVEPPAFLRLCFLCVFLLRSQCSAAQPGLARAAPSHLALRQVGQLGRHSCAAMPVHAFETTGISWNRQMHLICSFDYVRDAKFRSEGSRNLSTDDPSQGLHGLWQLPGARVWRRAARAGLLAPPRLEPVRLPGNLLYHASFNVLYWSTYTLTSYARKQTVLKVRLNPGYSFLHADDDGTAHCAEPVRFQLPSTVTLPATSVTCQNVQYPQGGWLLCIHTHSLTHALSLTYVRTHTCALTHVRTHSHMHMHSHALSLTYPLTHTCARTLAYAHLHTHYTLNSSNVNSPREITL